ncbi:hypothetical protein [Halosolutus halophilus]|uniref:hypothetical protein n=1 Tax=Halosolutus halophilus TaxID=1552990 RepID=UPI0022351DD9|nr:hypothetical protein [Halosolutus halophilus]
MFDDTYSNGIIRSEGYLTADQPHHPPVDRDAEIHAFRHGGHLRIGRFVWQFAGG